ncbi:MAG TPA: lysine--tRNA ligase, partial [Campylobacterales bacterium]|nr:lysine--tRNA ligase [Campylobacterales bacterium]
MFSSKYIQQRIEKGKALRELGKNPYENRVSRDCYTSQFVEKFQHIKSTEEKRDENSSCKVIGRIKFLRLMGKASFMKIEDFRGVLQIYINQNR